MSKAESTARRFRRTASRAFVAVGSRMGLAPTLVLLLAMVAVLVLATLAPPIASAQTSEVLLEFDPIEIGASTPVPANGVMVSGVGFTFTEAGVPSTAAEYGASGPGALVYVDGAVLGGPAGGTLTIDFGAPTALVEFGVALNTIGSVSPGFSVEIFDESLVSIGQVDVDTATLVGFSEGQFLHTGVPLSRVVVTFDTTFSQIGGNREFAFDQLRFEVPDEPMPAVPSLGAVAAVTLVIFLLAMGLRGMRASRATS